MSSNESTITSGMARIGLQDAQQHMLMDVTINNDKAEEASSLELMDFQSGKDSEQFNKFAWIGPGGDPGPEVSGKLMAVDEENQPYNRVLFRPLDDDDSFFSEDYFEEDFLWDDDY